MKANQTCIFLKSEKLEKNYIQSLFIKHCICPGPSCSKVNHLDLMLNINNNVNKETSNCACWDIFLTGAWVQFFIKYNQLMKYKHLKKWLIFGAHIARKKVGEEIAFWIFISLYKSNEIILMMGDDEWAILCTRPTRWSWARDNFMEFCNREDELPYLSGFIKQEKLLDINFHFNSLVCYKMNFIFC